ncbi:TIGR03435 family protein [Granulicella pectinivorans]|uniref:TIGR03435 family protein n=1 Tax=Granulicella pectinivorans TaxID=474950 RepID=UPI000B7DE9C6|nr:TIGR03435 family protein [Granulicella pectinivorans]
MLPIGRFPALPVNDATGLTGVYDITLHFRPEETTSDESAHAPSVFSALQEQLGLKLLPSKGPVETLTVEAARRPEADETRPATCPFATNLPLSHSAGRDPSRPIASRTRIR